MLGEEAGEGGARGTGAHDQEIGLDDALVHNHCHYWVPELIEDRNTEKFHYKRPGTHWRIATGARGVIYFPPDGPILAPSPSRNY